MTWIDKQHYRTLKADFFDRKNSHLKTLVARNFNLYLEKSGDDFIEFDSMVNIKPAFGNRSRGVENEEIREKIKKIVKKIVPHP